MGKIVKYCAGCEESFAEKFGFCPNCGKAMEAFEMSPVMGEAKAISESKPTAPDNNLTAEAALPELVAEVLPESHKTLPPSEPLADTSVLKTAGETQILADTAAAAPLIENEAAPQSFDNFDDFEDSFGSLKAEYLDDAPVEEAAADLAEEPEETFAATTAAGVAANAAENPYQTKNYNYQATPISRTPSGSGFNVTVIQEKNAKQRNLLLLGAMALMLTLTAGGMVYSIFNHPLMIGAIGDDLAVYVPVVDDEAPVPVEEEVKPKPDKGGGGGGGGRNEETPTSKGRLATQTPDPPLIAPDKTIVQKDFELKQPIATTQGNKVVKPTEEPYGDPNAKFLGALSNGTGRGGGQGSGEGTGQGSGRGTGQGSGLGSGSGNGNGNGNGNGTGNGNDGRDAPPPPPKAPVGVTEKIKFILKPRAGYTDQARTNQIQGTVRVRVTFLPSGQIGSVAPVSGLPYGLTEQAIAAAKQIKFEPAKKNGVPVTTVAVVEYNFNIY